jgi:heme exporter protein C
MAVRMAEAYTHPRVFATADGGLPPRMMVAFLVMLVAVALLYVTLYRYEMTSKNTSAQLRALRRRLAGDEAVAPAGRTAAPSLPST